MWELIQENFSSILVFVSGGGLASVATIKYTRKTAQADAMKSVQSVYQETIQDLRKDKELMKEESNDLRKQLQTLKHTVDRNTEDISRLVKLKCNRPDCKERIID